MESVHFQIYFYVHFRILFDNLWECLNMEREGEEGKKKINLTNPLFSWSPVVVLVTQSSPRGRVLV